MTIFQARRWFCRSLASIPSKPLRVCVVGSGPAGFYTAEKVSSKPLLRLCACENWKWVIRNGIGYLGLRGVRCWRRTIKHTLISLTGCPRLSGWFVPVLHPITLKPRSIIIIIIIFVTSIICTVFYNFWTSNSLALVFFRNVCDTSRSCKRVGRKNKLLFLPIQSDKVIWWFGVMDISVGVIRRSWVRIPLLT